MKTEKNILIALILNVLFSLFEIIGGIFTNSMAIISDAVHDFGDAISIGLSYFLERKSKKSPDDQYTYGYIRYSILGAFITTMILAISSIFVIYHSVMRLFSPVSIHYDGMIIFAVIGVIVNFLAAYFTREGDSLNQKSVNLHMLEDVLSWIVVLIGSILMKITNIFYIDSIMSILVALFLFINAIKNLKSILDLFLEKTPVSISIEEIKKHILEIDGVKEVHHIHLWSIDGSHNYATMHVVTNNSNNMKIKNLIRSELLEHGIVHVTIEIETMKEHCESKDCEVHYESIKTHHHHH